jgi:ATP synthase protein I
MHPVPDLDRGPPSQYVAAAFRRGTGHGQGRLRPLDRRPLTSREPPPSLDDLEARLDKARAAQDQRAGGDAKGRQPGAMGVAMQAAFELVGALGVAVGIGWVLDRQFGTAPLFLVIFFFLGAAAGGLNVYRRAKQLAGDAADDGDANSHGR